MKTVNASQRTSLTMCIVVSIDLHKPNSKLCCPFMRKYALWEVLFSRIYAGSGNTVSRVALHISGASHYKFTVYV